MHINMKLDRHAVLTALIVSPLTLPAGAETLDTLAEFGNAATANANSGAGTARGFTNPAADEYTITAGGTDFWGGSDNGTFIYDADQSRADGENFSVIVRSVSVAGDPAETLAGEWGRTGPMARKTPDAANSAYVAHIRKSGGNPAGTNPADTLIQGRQSDGAGSDRGPGENGEHRNFAENTLNGSVRNTPIWLGLHRYNGEWYSTWAPDNAGVPGEWSSAIQRVGTPDLTGEVWVGLAHQSHNINPVTNTAVFESFEVGEFDPNLGAFPVVTTCELELSPDGILLTASGTELGTVDPIDVSWEARYIGAEETLEGVLKADIYLAGNPGNLAAIQSLIDNSEPSGSTRIEQIHWAANAYTTTNAGGVNLFSQAVPGSFGGDQNDYGVVMTGEIFIPSDTSRDNVESIKFKDGVDDFCYLEIDGVQLINDNSWSNLAGTGNNGGAQATFDVSDSKFDDGEWVSFRLITWEGGGGDDVILLWDALDRTGLDSDTGAVDAVTGTYPIGLIDGNQVPFNHDFSDKIPAANFRTLVPGLRLTESGVGQPDQLVLPGLSDGTFAIEIYLNDELCTSASTIVEMDSAAFTSTNTMEVVLADVGTGGIADVDPTTLTATLDGVSVTPVVSKDGLLTTVSYTFAEDPVPYTNHTLEISGQTTAGTGSVSFTLAGTARSLPLLDELRAGLSAPPNATTGWDYMEFDVISTLGGNLGAGPQAFIDAQTVISTAAAPTAQAVQPYVNHSDPDDSGSRGDWLPDLPILSDDLGLPDDQFVTYARTTITIGAGEEGEYTIRVTGDDGFGLRINGATFSSVVGDAANRLSPADPSVVFRPAYGGNGNVFAFCNFPVAGDYLVEFFGFEGGGGSYQEVSWARGLFTSVNATSSWALIGDTSSFDPESRWGEIPEAILPPLPTGGENGWSTYFYYNASVGNLTNTMNYLRDVADPLTATAAIVPELNHGDDGGNGGVFNPSAPYPGDPNPADTDNIALIARANVVAPVTGEYTIQVRSDDGFLLRFTNPDNNFTSLSGGGNLSPSALNEVYFENGTGDTNTRASVFLEAGLHELVYIWWEGGGGSHFEISSAPGIEPNHNGSYELLNTTESATNLYIGGGSTTELAISEIIYNSSTDEFTLTFNSGLGRNYIVTADTDLQGFETEIGIPISGTGDAVIVGPFANPFPDSTRAFFRVEEVRPR